MTTQIQSDLSLAVIFQPTFSDGKAVITQLKENLNEIPHQAILNGQVSASDGDSVLDDYLIHTVEVPVGERIVPITETALRHLVALAKEKLDEHCDNYGKAGHTPSEELADELAALDEANRYLMATTGNPAF